MARPGPWFPAQPSGYGRPVRHIGTDEVRELLDAGAQPLEVLPEKDYLLERLPGAISIPLPNLTRDTAEARLDRDRPVVVYCYDTQCDLSARGAALVERYGFGDVYDYTGSKMAWLAEGLPSEGSRPARQRVGALVREAATCGPDDPTSDLPDEPPGGVVVIVDPDGIVLGSLQPTRLRGAHATALEVAQPGSSTVRPSIAAQELAESMDRNDESHVLVTTIEGMLLGIALREDLDVDR